MLMTPMTPKVIARPIAASSRTDEAEIPYQRFCATPHKARRAWMALSAVAAALFTCRVGGPLRNPVDEALRVLITALLQRRNRGETVLG